MDRLRRERGLCSDSELVRRLIDDAPLKGAPPIEGLGPVVLPRRGLDLAELQERVERALIAQALRAEKGNITRAAELLGLSRRGLQKRLARTKGAATANEGRTA